MICSWISQDLRQLQINNWEKIKFLSIKIVNQCRGSLNLANVRRKKMSDRNTINDVAERIVKRKKMWMKRYSGIRYRESLYLCETEHFASVRVSLFTAKHCVWHGIGEKSCYKTQIVKINWFDGVFLRVTCTVISCAYMKILLNGFIRKLQRFWSAYSRFCRFIYFQQWIKCYSPANVYQRERANDWILIANSHANIWWLILYTENKIDDLCTMFT